MGGGHVDELHGAIQAAEEREVGALWIHVGRLIVHLHGERFCLHVGEVDAERGEAAAMLAQQLVTREDARDVVRRLEFDEAM